ncbi:MAG: putative Ig domain-containing protein, partial [Candidatus Omnitrophota bacterium]
MKALRNWSGLKAVLFAGIFFALSFGFACQASADDKSITVTYPNGGEVVSPGATQTIEWTSTGDVGNVDIKLSVNNGASWMNIVTDTINDGTENVTVPYMPSANCLIKVKEHTGTTFDNSNAAFRINTPPVLDPIGDQSTDENLLLEIGPTGTDADNDVLTYSADNLPSGATFTNGVFSWLPTYQQAGNYYNVHFEVTDGFDVYAEDITITVNNVNTVPVLERIGDMVVNEPNTLSFDISATDEDGDVLTYSASNLPGGNFFPADRAFTWDTDYQSAGVYPNVHFEVTDGVNVVSEDITITVDNVNTLPFLNIEGANSINEDDTLAVDLAASDEDGDPLTLSAVNVPDHANFTSVGNSGTFIWTPDYDQAGDYSIRFEVTDGVNIVAQDFPITVNNVNRPPVLNSIGNKTVDEVQALAFTVSATDPDGQTITYYVENLPDGAAFDSETGAFNWTPTYEQAALYENITFTASDGDLSDPETISIIVNNVNRSPVLSPIGNKLIDETMPLTFTLSSTDPDADDVTYTCTNLPVGAALDPNTGVFTWTPAFPGTYENVHFVVTDDSPDGVLTDTEDIAIYVGYLPVIDPIGAQSIDEGQALSFTISGSDADNDPIAYSAANLPGGATFDAGTMTFSWIPGYDAAGTSQTKDYTLTFTISDGTGTDTENVTITVNNVNRAPVLGDIGAKTVAEDVELSFPVLAT